MQAFLTKPVIYWRSITLWCWVRWGSKSLILNMFQKTILSNPLSDESVPGAGLGSGIQIPFSRQAGGTPPGGLWSNGFAQGFSVLVLWTFWVGQSFVLRKICILHVWQQLWLLSLDAIAYPLTSVVKIKTKEIFRLKATAANLMFSHAPSAS